MNNSGEWTQLNAQLKILSKWIISSLIDSGFLAIWVFLQWLVNTKLIANLELSGIDRWVRQVFEVLFAISTLAPVVIYIYVDIRVMLLRARKTIQREIELSGTHGTNDN